MMSSLNIRQRCWKRPLTSRLGDRRLARLTGLLKKSGDNFSRYLSLDGGVVHGRSRLRLAQRKNYPISAQSNLRVSRP